MTAIEKCMKTLQCLYVAVDKLVCDDVKQKVIDAFDEAYDQALDDLMNEVEKSSFTGNMKEMLRQMTIILKE